VPDRGAGVAGGAAGAPRGLPSGVIGQDWDGNRAAGGVSGRLCVPSKVTEVPDLSALPGHLM
jgi:hypothetical protein